MIAFWSIAALFLAIALALLLWPIWRQRRAQGRWSVSALAAALVMVGLAPVLYLAVSNWDLEEADHLAQQERIVAQFAERLRSAPDNVEGWKLLARSYITLGHNDAGLDAYREAWKRTPAPDNELKTDFAEAQVLVDRSALTGEAGRLFEQVLAAEPNNPKALWYGGMLALQNGRQAEFKERWSRLLALNVLPDELANVVRTELAQEGGGPAQGAAPDSAPTPAPIGPRVSVRLTLGAGRSLEDLGPNAALFIMALAPGGGPPVAVIKQPAEAVPGEFTLSDANSMIPGRSLANYDELTLVARLSRSGQPGAQPGDWFAQTAFRPKESGTLALVIDQVVQ
jgi:cytochrome c-type biogenesis protein CcmH